MSSFKSIKSLFFVEEEPEEEAKVSNSLPSSAPLPAQPPVNQISAQHNSAAALDQRIFDALQKALADHNMQGFDYFEFRNALKSLEAIIPDETMRFKSAFATAQAMGLTQPKLVESAKYYVSVLENEQQKFSQALEAQIDKGIVAKQQQIKDLEAEIARKTDEIARITQEIQVHKQQMAEAVSEVAEVESKIAATKNNFSFTLQTVVQGIQKDLQNIERFLA
jgi:chromosome segregation ATPase